MILYCEFRSKQKEAVVAYCKVRGPPGLQSKISQSRQTIIYGHESRDTRNQESPWWRVPAAVYWTGLDWTLSATMVQQT
jgi:hypothetical protein